MITVVPAIIPYSKEQMEEEIKKVSSFASLLQIDISEGIFTPVKTWPYNNRDLDFFQKLKTQEVGWPEWQKVNYEIHLMIKKPEEVLVDWISSGASGIIAHIEATENFQKMVDVCRESFVTIGLAIKPSTDIQRIEKFVPQVDFIQVMGSDKLGYHGVELEKKSVEMIQILHSSYPDSIIAIDIGVTEQSAVDLVSLGVSKLITGSAILNASQPRKVFDSLSSLK